MAKCKPCGKGKHDDDCEQLGCTCWCISEAVPFRGARIGAPGPREDITALLKQMREANLTCRTTKDEMIVYRPKPATLDPELRKELVKHSFDLSRVLVAYRRKLPTSRPHWTYGPLGECFGCKISCCTLDPLGHYRHAWCGWLGQKSKLPPIKPAPLYPNMSSGTPVWSKSK